MGSSRPSIKKLRPLQLAAIIFLTVSGGPYGLEPLFSYVGDHGALFLLLITPLLWDIPTILTVLELNSLMPETGGYYQWVKRALGLQWAFYEGWWTWLYTFVDLAIYPVLFVGYMSFFFPEIAPYKVPVCLFIIWISAILNILGIALVGRISIILGALVLIPFLVLFIVVLTRHTGHFSISVPSLKGEKFPALSMGLYTVMWNFIGWDNITTYAGEVSRPVRSYLLSMTTAFVLIVGLYLVTALSVHQSGINAEILNKGGFPILGVLAGGIGWVSCWRRAAWPVQWDCMPRYFYPFRVCPRSWPMIACCRKKCAPFIPGLNALYLHPYFFRCRQYPDLIHLFRPGDHGYHIVRGGPVAGIYRVTRSSCPGTRYPPAIQDPIEYDRPFFMTLLPLGIYAIALSGAIYASDKNTKIVFLALGMLLSAVFAWRLIVWEKPELRARPSYPANRR